MGDVIEFEGTVLEASRGDTYRVECVAGALRRTVLAEAQRAHELQPRAGRRRRPRVRVEVSPYDTTRGRIVRRLDGEAGA